MKTQKFVALCAIFRLLATLNRKEQDDVLAAIKAAFEVADSKDAEDRGA